MLLSLPFRISSPNPREPLHQPQAATGTSCLVHQMLGMTLRRSQWSARVNDAAAACGRQRPITRASVTLICHELEVAGWHAQATPRQGRGRKLTPRRRLSAAGEIRRGEPVAVTALSGHHGQTPRKPHPLLAALYARRLPMPPAANADVCSPAEDRSVDVLVGFQGLPRSARSASQHHRRTQKQGPGRCGLGGR